MKCPKCSYVSFDYNLTCPKCDKDISSEQEKLHLPAFRPDPPFLLGALTGEADDSHIAGVRGSSEIAMSHGEEISFDDESSHFDSREVSMPESEEFELGSEEISLDDTDGLNLDSDNRRATGKSGAQDILGMDLDTEDAIAELNLGGAGEYELGADTGELEIVGREDTAGDELSLDLGEAPEDEGSLDLESLDLEGGPEQSRAGTETATRELRLDRESTEELDKLLDMDEIRLDEVSLDAKPGAEMEKRGKTTQSQENELSLDLGELDLELDLEDSKPH